MSFFENLNFSSSNEDGASELAALEGARRILCLTGSGTRPFDMLMSNAEEIIALDVNPAQNALLSLKVAAIEALDYDDYLAFVGIAPSDDRLSAYQSLRSRLPQDVQHHWDRRRNMIASGVWYAGKWEKLLAWNGRLVKLLHGRAVNALFEAASVEEQAQIWRDRFEKGLLRRAIEMGGRQWVWKWVMREPAGAFLPDAKAVADRLQANFKRASETFLFRESDFACLALLGRMPTGGAVPLHCRPENYARLRAALPRLRIMTGGLSDLRSLGLGGIDGFSVSDFGSYCGPQFYKTCWENISAVAARHSKFCERIFLNDMPLPLPNVRENEVLSGALTARDRAIIYDVRAGDLEGSG